MHIIICRLLGIWGWGGCLIYGKCHTQYGRSILRIYWSFFIVAKRFFSYVCMIPSNSVLFCGMIISVVDCRQPGCSYKVEPSFVEKRRIYIYIYIYIYIPGSAITSSIEECIRNGV